MLRHRVYLKIFEDALRSVPGCENVTLPYWDITTPIPTLLKTPPFDSYVVPIDLGGSLGANYKTRRFDQATIDTNLANYDVFDDLDTALTQSLWGASGLNRSGFQGFSISAHDGGHGSIGPTMGNQNVASYDPICWFFHCNLDRHWLTWQKNVRRPHVSLCAIRGRLLCRRQLCRIRAMGNAEALFNPGGHGDFRWREAQGRR